MSVVARERPARVKVSVGKRSLMKERELLLARLQEVNLAIEADGAGKRGDGKLSLAELRAALGWSRNQMAQVINASDRAIVNWESGDPVSSVYAAKVREIQSIFHELKHWMEPKEIGPWLRTEMEEFENRSPADLIRKGETGRVWESLFYMRTGMPD